MHEDGHYLCMASALMQTIDWLSCPPGSDGQNTGQSQMARSGLSVTGGVSAGQVLLGELWLNL